MKLLSTAALLAVALALLPLASLAAPPALPPDVPARHPAAASVGRVLHEKILGRDPDGRFRGDKPVTRYELAIALDRFVRYIEAAHRPLHLGGYPWKSTLASQAPPAARDAIQHLVSNGFLPANSSLVTQSGAGQITASELSGALAAVTIRLSDRAEPLRKDP